MSKRAVVRNNGLFVLATRDLLTGYYGASRYSGVFAEYDHPNFVCQQFGLAKHVPLPIGTEAAIFGGKELSVGAWLKSSGMALVGSMTASGPIIKGLVFPQPETTRKNPSVVKKNSAIVSKL